MFIEGKVSEIVGGCTIKVDVFHTRNDEGEFVDSLPIIGKRGTQKKINPDTTETISLWGVEVSYNEDDAMAYLNKRIKGEKVVCRPVYHGYPFDRYHMGAMSPVSGVNGECIAQCFIKRNSDVKKWAGFREDGTRDSDNIHPLWTNDTKNYLMEEWLNFYESWVDVARILIMESKASSDGIYSGDFYVADLSNYNLLPLNPD